MFRSFALTTSVFLALSLVTLTWGVEEIEDVDLRTLDQIEMDIMNSKIKLLKERLEYLHSVEDTGCDAPVVDPTSPLSKNLIQTKTLGNKVADNFAYGSIRSNMNAQSMENSAFHERTMVYAEN